MCVKYNTEDIIKRKKIRVGEMLTEAAAVSKKQNKKNTTQKQNCRAVI